MWCPGSGVVLDCIDSLSLPSYLLRSTRQFFFVWVPEETTQSHVLFLCLKTVYNSLNVNVIQRNQMHVDKAFGMLQVTAGLHSVLCMSGKHCLLERSDICWK